MTDVTRTTPKFYSHAELNKPAPIIAAKPLAPKQENPYLSALYNCGEALL